jgi:hypothetical protein
MEYHEMIQAHRSKNKTSNVAQAGFRKLLSQGIGKDILRNGNCNRPTKGVEENREGVARRHILGWKDELCCDEGKLYRTACTETC